MHTAKIQVMACDIYFMAPLKGVANGPSLSQKRYNAVFGVLKNSQEWQRDQVVRAPDLKFLGRGFKSRSVR